MSDLRISNDISEMDIPLIHHFLATESYWARGLQFEALTKSLSHSLCFAGFIGEKQVAFGRVITDLASFGYLKDIFVLPSERGRGYGKELVEAMLANSTTKVLLRSCWQHGMRIRSTGRLDLKMSKARRD